MLQAEPESVVRRADGSFVLRWTTQAPGAWVSVHAGPQPGDIDSGRPLARTRAESVEIRGLDPGRRHYFVLVPEGAPPLVVGERRLALEGARNFRDAGGYATTGGRRVGWGRLYRSDHLARLSESDRGYVARLGLSLICDFRSDPERERRPNRLPPGTGARTVVLGIEPGSHLGYEELLRSGNATARSTREFMIEINREFATHHADTYARMFDWLLEGPPGAALLHCAGGKDRTGFGTALVLLALGVPRETVMEDYLLTRNYLPWHGEHVFGQREREEIGLGDVDPSVLRPLVEVQPEYLGAAFEAIEAEHDSLEAYLVERLGLRAERRAELRARLLD